MRARGYAPLRASVSFPFAWTEPLRPLEPLQHLFPAQELHHGAEVGGVGAAGDGQTDDRGDVARVGTSVMKVIAVPNKLVNLIVK